LNKGGGHRNASGAAIPHIITNPPGTLIDNYAAYNLLDTLYVTEYGGKKYIVVNTAILQKHIVKYLIQERFFGNESAHKNGLRYNNNLVGYQEGMYCMRNRTGNDDLDEYYNGAIAWNYDGMKMEYILTIALPPNTPVDKLIKYFEMYKALDESFEWKFLGNNTYFLKIRPNNVTDFINDCAALL
jgi:hypothetical protein